MQNEDFETCSSPLVKFAFLLSAQFLLPLLCILIFADIFARNVLDFPLHWTSEVGGLLLLLFFITAMPMASFPVRGDPAGRHLVMSYFYERMDPKAKRRCKRGHAASGLIISLVIAVEAALDTIEKIRFEERSETLGVPLWPASAVLCLCLVLMGVHYWRALGSSWTKGGKP